MSAIGASESGRAREVLRAVDVMRIATVMSVGVEDANAIGVVEAVGAVMASEVREAEGVVEAEVVRAREVDGVISVAAGDLKVINSIIARASDAVIFELTQLWSLPYPNVHNPSGCIPSFMATFLQSRFESARKGAEKQLQGFFLIKTSEFRMMTTSIALSGGHTELLEILTSVDR
ncbi:hypothetical protein K440DRAFT_643995 [Wilcoxina mikolae CBS 423.85]|nr:hypothetical protein K440DRAFT_643995 [Wilcoxina mikolae CBS 423.85]